MTPSLSPICFARITAHLCRYDQSRVRETAMGTLVNGIFMMCVPAVIDDGGAELPDGVY